MKLFPFAVPLLFTGVLLSQQPPVPAATPVASATAAPITQAAKLDHNAFVFTSYKLKLQFDLVMQSLGVRGTVTVRNDSAVPQPVVPLQISSQLHWATVRVPGKESSFSVHALDSDIDHSGAVNEATITLPEPLAPGATVTLEVGYEGAMPQNTQRLDRIDTPPQLARHSDWDQITHDAIYLRGVGYVAWFPVSINPAMLSEGPAMFEQVNGWKLAHARSSMDLDIVIHGAETANRLFINGQIVPVKKEAAGESADLTAQSHNDAIGFNSPTLALGDWAMLSTPAATIYYAAEDKPLAEQYAASAAASAKLLTGWFGTQQRPFQMIQIGDKNAPFGYDATLFVPLTPESTNMLSLALTYSMTHAYFDSRRLWMREGLAWFMQVMAMDDARGRTVALKYLEDRQGGLSLAEPEGDNPNPSGSLVQSAQEVRYRDKAVFVWWMLRDMVGEPVLQRALQAYRADQDIQPAYFQKLLEKESKKDLEWFFDDWVYRDRSLPEFKIESTFARKELNGMYLVTVTVSNAGKTGAEVPVVVRTAAGSASARIVVRGEQKGVARIEVTQAPTEASVNDGSVPETDNSDHTVSITVKQEKEPEFTDDQNKP